MKFVVMLVSFSLFLSCGQGNVEARKSTPHGVSKNERHRIIKRLKPQIVQASKDTRLKAELIAAVLNNELKLRDFIDDRQDKIAREALQKSGEQRQKKLNQVPRNRNQSLWDVSFGFAQMKANVIVDLHDSKHLWRVPSGFQRNDIFDSVKMLVDETYAPYLIAYRLRQIRDKWLDSTTKLGCPKDFFKLGIGSGVLATLYSIGITGSSGFHCNPRANSRGNEIVSTHGEMLQVLGL